jgi:ribose 5-phosphate isomerase B
MRIYVGSDHRGFSLKEKLTKWLFEHKYDFVDLGAHTLDPEDDYSKYASEVASLVGKDANSKGVLLCGSGVGVDIVANKFDGVRSSLGKTPKQVREGRNDDDMNILVLAADFTKLDEAIKMLREFLGTKFAGKNRFKRRLSDIEKIEANN